MFPFSNFDKSLVAAPRDSVRVLLVGDTFVGKTTLLRAFTGDAAASSGSVSYTIGCEVGVFAHHCFGKSFFIELLEVGGAPAFEQSRKMFFEQPFHGIIGVYDLSNLNSRNNLDTWFREVVGLGAGLDVLPFASLPRHTKHGTGQNVLPFTRTPSPPPVTSPASMDVAEHNLCLDLELHPKKHLAGRFIPLLIVGNKSDVLLTTRQPLPQGVGAEDLKCSSRYLGREDNARLAAFFDAVVFEAKFRVRTEGQHHQRSLLGASPPPTPVKLAFSPMSSHFDARAAKKKDNGKLQADDAEVRLRIDF